MAGAAAARTDAPPSPTPASTPKRAAAKPAPKAESARQAKRARAAKPSTQRRSKPASNGTRKRSTKLDLNKATFDQLRDLGLGDNGWQERLATYYNPFLAGPFV